MKKILSLSAVALVLSGCSAAESQGSKPVSTTGQSTKESTTVTTTTKAPETTKEVTTEKKEETKRSSQFSAYVGTYTGENGSLTLNEDGSITDGGQTHKPMNITTDNGRIIIESNLTVATLPVLLSIYPAGVKDSMSGDSSKNRIMKDSPKGAAYLFTQGGSSAKPSPKPTTEMQTLPGGGLGREAPSSDLTVLPAAGAVVRKGSTTQSAAITTLKKGTRVYVDKVVTNPYGESWTMIMINGDYGFIRSDLLG